MEKCCGKCKHHIPPWRSGLPCGWYCNNEDSEAYGFETEYNDCCEDFEERD